MKDWCRSGSYTVSTRVDVDNWCKRITVDINCWKYSHLETWLNNFAWQETALMSFLLDEARVNLMCSKVQKASLMSSGTFIRVSPYWQHLMFITIPPFHGCLIEGELILITSM